MIKGILLMYDMLCSKGYSLAYLLKMSLNNDILVLYDILCSKGYSLAYLLKTSLNVNTYPLLDWCSKEGIRVCQDASKTVQKPTIFCTCPSSFFGKQTHMSVNFLYFLPLCV